MLAYCQKPQGILLQLPYFSVTPSSASMQIKLSLAASGLYLIIAFQPYNKYDQPVLLKIGKNHYIGKTTALLVLITTIGLID